MTCLRSISPLIVGILALGFPSQAQTITLDEFLERLKQVHPIFEKEQMTARIEAEEQRSYLGSQDWNATSSVFIGREEPVIAFAGPKRTDVLTVSGGVERLFWNTGGRLSASFSSSWTGMKIDPLYGLPESFYQNQIAVTYAHPLLKNRGGFLDQLEYELKRFDIDVSQVQALENQEDFLASAAATFLDWVLLSEQKEILSERLRLSVEQLTTIEERRRAQLVDEIDVIRARDAVRIVRQNQVFVQSQWKALQAELAVLSRNEQLYNASPHYDLYEVVNLVPVPQAVLELKRSSRIITALTIQLKQLQYARKGFNETTKPDLSLVAQFNAKNADECFGTSLQMDKPDAGVGLQLSLPLGNRTARSMVARTDLQMAQLEKQIEEITLELTSVLTNLHIQIGELKEVLRLNREQIESAREKTREELKLYNQGRSQLTFVIQSRDGEENAKLTYAQNALIYHKLLLQYRSLRDELF